MNTITAKNITDKIYNKEFRQKLLSDNPSASTLEEIGYHHSEGVEVKIVESTKDTLYIAMPSQAIDLDQVSAGVTVGLGSAGTVSTFTSTISSTSTAGCAILT